MPHTPAKGVHIGLFSIKNNMVKFSWFSPTGCQFCCFHYIFCVHTARWVAIRLNGLASVVSTLFTSFSVPDADSRDKPARPDCGILVARPLTDKGIGLESNESPDGVSPTNGPAIHGSKLEDFLISEANMIEDGLLPWPTKPKGETDG
jgi:hypothetical protein